MLNPSTWRCSYEAFGFMPTIPKDLEQSHKMVFIDFYRCSIPFPGQNKFVFRPLPLWYGLVSEKHTLCLEFYH